MTQLVFLLEEVSAQVMLQGLLPRIAANPPPVRYIPFEGKQDLERQLVRKIRNYQVPGARFIVVRDQDAHPDCVALKQRLRELCVEAGQPTATIRIFCRELETIYLADLAAVERGLGMAALARRQHTAKFREPDRLVSPSEELRKLTGGAYQKIGGSRAIAPHLDLDNPRSRSFANIVSCLRRLCATG